MGLDIDTQDENLGNLSPEEFNRYFNLLLSNLSSSSEIAISFLYSFLSISTRGQPAEEYMRVLKEILDRVLIYLYQGKNVLENKSPESNTIITNILSYFISYPNPLFINILNEEESIFENIFNTNPALLFLLYEEYIKRDINNKLLLNHLSDLQFRYFTGLACPEGHRFVKGRLKRLIATLQNKVSE